MIRYLIKNNFKLMFRNKWNIPVMILGPVLVIAILSSAFEDLMKSYEGVEEFRAGYRIEEGSIFGDNIEEIKDAGEEAGITFLEYPEGEPQEMMEHNDLAGFVEFGTDEYTVYESADFEVEGITLEYFVNRVMEEGVNQALQSMTQNEKEDAISLPVETLDYMLAIDSKDYYGIIYIVYFSWMGIICAASILNNEKRYGIGNKFRVAAVSGWKLYFGKLLPDVLVVFAGMGIAAGITSLLYGIHWGNIFLSASLMLLTIMASSAFGLMLYYIFNNLIITIILLFTSVWFMGFFGGSFETYMYSNWSDTVKNLSPIYHTNRALVEISCMGHSSYTGSCIIYMLAITVICSVIAIGVDGLRKRGRA